MLYIQIWSLNLGKKTYVILRHLGSIEKNKKMFAVYIYDNLNIHNVTDWTQLKKDKKHIDYCQLFTILTKENDL